MTQPAQMAQREFVVTARSSDAAIDAVRERAAKAEQGYDDIEFGAERTGPGRYRVFAAYWLYPLIDTTTLPTKLP